MLVLLVYYIYYLSLIRERPTSCLMPRISVAPHHLNRDQVVRRMNVGLNCILIDVSQ